MKKQTGFTFLTLVVLAIFSISANGQEANNISNEIVSANNENVSANKVIYKTTPAKDVIVKNAEMIKVPDTIEKNFSKFYPKAQRVQWSKIENGFLVSCMVDGQNTRAFFREDGQLNYSITQLSIINLPAKLQRLLKNEYANFNVIKALKINNLGNITYQVILKNEVKYVTVKSNGDEIEISTIKNASSKNTIK